MNGIGALERIPYLYLCRPRRAEMEGWDEPEAACSSGQTSQCSPWDALSHTCAWEKPRQWSAPEIKNMEIMTTTEIAPALETTRTCVTNEQYRDEMFSPSLFHVNWDPEARAGTETALMAVWQSAPWESSCPNTPETETTKRSQQTFEWTYRELFTRSPASSLRRVPRPHSSVGSLPTQILL